MASILLVGALLGQTGWTSVAPVGEAFTAKMPAKPQRQNMENSQAGYKVSTRVYKSESKGGMAQVIIMDPYGTPGADFTKGLITGFKGGLLKTSGGKETGTSSATLGGVPATRVSFTVGPNKGEYLATVYKSNAYVVLAVGNPTSFNSLKTAFFNGFKFRK